MSAKSMAEVLAEALYDRGNDVRQWPEDERELYREASCISFSEAREAVAKLRFEKAAEALAEAGFGDLEDAWDGSVYILRSYAEDQSMAGAYFPEWETTARLIAATPDLNPYRKDKP